MSQGYWDKLQGDAGDITRIQIFRETHGRKRFPGELVSIQNTRKKEHELGEKTRILFLVLHKSLNNAVKWWETCCTHRGSCWKFEAFPIFSRILNLSWAKDALPSFTARGRNFEQVLWWPHLLLAFFSTKRMLRNFLYSNKEFWIRETLFLFYTTNWILRMLLKVHCFSSKLFKVNARVA